MYLSIICIFPSLVFSRNRFSRWRKSMFSCFESLMRQTRGHPLPSPDSDSNEAMPSIVTSGLQESSIRRDIQVLKNSVSDDTKLLKSRRMIVLRLTSKESFFEWINWRRTLLKYSLIVSWLTVPFLWFIDWECCSRNDWILQRSQFKEFDGENDDWFPSWLE